MCVRVAGGPRCSGFTFSQIGGMMWAMANIRLIKHEVIPDCESFEVRYPDGRPSQGSSQRCNVSAMAALGLASRLSQAPVFADRAFHAIVCIFLKTCCDGEIHQCD
jgi:hypothetical protein